jgi:hypothetical protein
MHETSNENECNKNIINCITLLNIEPTISIVSQSLNCRIYYENNIQDYMFKGLKAS